MNTLIIYFSKFGNTEQIAETIADVLAASGPVRTVTTSALTAAALEKADLVVIGSPTHRMNLPDEVKALFKTLPRRIMRKTPVAVFDTSYQMSWWLNTMTAAKRLAGRVRRLGGKLIVPPETFLVVERSGPLFDGELERAREWAGTILSRIEPERA